jgi:hypothetical protein
MATEEEGDDEATSSSGDRQGGDKQNIVGGDRQDGDMHRQDGESEENSWATRRQRLGDGGIA